MRPRQDARRVSFGQELVDPDKDFFRGISGINAGEFKLAEDSPLMG